MRMSYAGAARATRRRATVVRGACSDERAADIHKHHTPQVSRFFVGLTGGERAQCRVIVLVQALGETEFKSYVGVPIGDVNSDVSRPH